MDGLKTIAMAIREREIKGKGPTERSYSIFEERPAAEKEKIVSKKAI